MFSSFLHDFLMKMKTNVPIRDILIVLVKIITPYSITVLTLWGAQPSGPLWCEPLITEKKLDV